ncbi:Zn(II)2Cys6 transcription factor [Aspergillus venezuelensis]
MGSSSKAAEKRRVVNACTRCRQHKIKCSGDSPCGNCQQRSVQCRFEGEEAKVHITKKHFSELKRRNLELEEENRVLQQQLSSQKETSPNYQGFPSGIITPVTNPIASGDVDDEESPSMTNPLSCGPPKYITDGAGRPHYLGHTSNWSLAVRLLHLTHLALYKCPFPSAAHHIDTMTYSLDWNGLRSSVIPDTRRLPSLDHALFLLNATKFHTGQMFHLFEEEIFMAHLHRFYENSAQRKTPEGLWFIHFLVIMALGKALVGGKSNGASPPGAEYFRTAFMMLPDYSFFWKDPCGAAELLCSMALYLQSIDWRTSAHNLIGQALRMLQVHGYHTNLSSVTNSKDLLRCQNVWWTVYVLERQMSVLMGAPPGISDSDVSASLPQYPNSMTRTMTLAIHSAALYRDHGHLNSTFVKATQEVLQRVANVASDLRQHFPVPEQESLGGISRVSGYLNLLYHQCIMLATRPFMFSLVETRVTSENVTVTVPTPIQLLLQICLESSKKTVAILTALQDLSLLEWFLPFDLESTVSAGLVITMASLVCPDLIDDHTRLLRTLSGLLNEMISKGNLIAEDQKKELNELEGICSRLNVCPDKVNMSDDTAVEASGLIMTGRNDHVEESELGPQEAWSIQPEASAWVRDMTPSQLLEVVDMLNGDNLLDWVDFPATALNSEETLDDVTSL